MSIPITTFIGILVSVTVLLVSIMVAIILWFNRHKLTCLAPPIANEYDDVIERNETWEVLRTVSEMEWKVNEAYKPTSQRREDEDGHGLYEEIH